MKGKLGKTIATFITAVLLLSILPVYAGVPSVFHDADAMWIEPLNVTLDTATHDVGYIFNVTVWINLSVTSKGWQFKMLYNKNHLKALRAGYLSEPAAPTKSQFFWNMTTMPVAPGFGVYDGTRDFVLHGEAVIMTPNRAPGYGGLSWVEFNVTSVPPKGSDLSSLIDISTEHHPPDSKTYALDETGSEIDLTVGDCPYSFQWITPPAPILAVDPAYVEYGIYDEANCSLFDVDVLIKNLASAWYLVNATIHLCFNSSLIVTEDANITMDPDNVWDFETGTYNAGVPWDNITFYVENTCGEPPLSGDVRIATVKFHVIYQGKSPPRPAGDYDETPLFFCYIELWDHSLDIDEEVDVGLEEGLVRIYCLMAIPPPWFEVTDPVDGDHYIELGPEPSIGEQFDVNINIANLSEPLYMVGYQIRLTFNGTLLDVVDVTEGPFLTDPTWNWYGTWFYSKVQSVPLLPPHDAIPTPHIIIAGVLYPNTTTGVYDQTEFPHTESVGTLATVTFEAIHQCYPKNYCCDLNITWLWYPLPDRRLIDKNGNWLFDTTPINATYCMRGDYWPGRMIDLTVGDGCWAPGPWPAPFGGQGLHQPSDMFWPQKIVYLYAEVTYNWYPVQDKIVSFEVEGPFNQTTMEPLPRYKVWAKLTAMTDKDGIAWVMFQLPWTGCSDPEGLFGKWKVTATVDICCTVVNDTTTFDYRYLVDWVSVTTDRYQYDHCNEVEITVRFKSKAQQRYPVLIVVVIRDNLDTPVACCWVLTWVEGAEPCHFKEYEVKLWQHIPKWAFAGEAWIHINAFDKDPTEGGVAWCPEYEPLPTIWIQPW